MRTIVMAEGPQNDIGVQFAQVWFRVPVTGANRQQYYAARQGGYIPQAPPDANGTKQQAELDAFHGGLYVERPPFQFRLDPAKTNAQKLTELQSYYADETAKYLASENAKFAAYNASFGDDGANPGGI